MSAGHAFGLQEFWSNYTRQPEWDAKEDKYILTITIPGAKKEDIDVSLNGQYISISYPGGEFAYKFSYRYKMPYELKSEYVSATCEAGVLTVEVAKHSGNEIKIQVK
jgi:HSP20 family molecular chaperone IbpA